MFPCNVAYRSGSDEDYTEKMHLLQEIDDLQEAGRVYLEEQNEAKCQAEKENKKKLRMKKQGADIRIQAMCTLSAGNINLLHLFLGRVMCHKCSSSKRHFCSELYSVVIQSIINLCVFCQMKIS